MGVQPVEPLPGSLEGLSSVRDVRAGDVLLSIPGSAAVTKTDVDQHDLLAPIAPELSELISLALWLVVERARGKASKWAPLVQALPTRSLSPLLWKEGQRRELLQGSPVLADAEARLQELDAQWRAIEAFLKERPEGRDIAQRAPSGCLTRQAFLEAFVVILGTTIYLPSAQCFALVPLVAQAKRGARGVALVDYDVESGNVLAVSDQPLRRGEPLLISDQRPNRELALAYGICEDDNMNDCLEYEASLIGADRLYTLKKQIVESEGFSDRQAFPLFQDRFPTQLLSYLRLARVQDPGELARVNFKRDNMVSTSNEYEVLMILMSECRDRLTAYETDLEEDYKLSMRGSKMSAEERLALDLRLSEKKILRGTMDALRRRLAPIRGIPTKSGSLEDQNQDLKEIFEAIESVPTLPKKVVDNFLSWARGDFEKNNQR